jgi:hypothetical protein
MGRIMMSAMWKCRRTLDLGQVGGISTGPLTTNIGSLPRERHISSLRVTRQVHRLHTVQLECRRGAKAASH